MKKSNPNSNLNEIWPFFVHLKYLFFPEDLMVESIDY